MGLLDIRETPRTLYIIAPTINQCHRAALEWGLTPPHIQHFRNITRAYQLRGVGGGTPFIAWGREFWPHTPDGLALDQAVTAYQRIGRLRIAQEEDIAACRPYDALPSRPIPTRHARAGL